MTGIFSILYLFYDARPITPLTAYEVQVTRITKAGNYKFKNLDAPGQYEDVVLNRDGSVRGWNTLCWRSERDLEAANAYREIRGRIALQAKEAAKP
jgi:hypothetical protein